MLAICGKSGLLVQVVKSQGAKAKRVTMDDAECLDVAWSSQGTFLGCIRREGNPVTTYAYLLLMDHQGPLVNYDSGMDYQELPLAETKLPGSQQANMLSFSPAENWLIVGKSIITGNSVQFNLYNLHESYGPNLAQPQILEIAID